MFGIMYKVCMIEHSDIEDNEEAKDVALYENQNDKKANEVSQPLMR